MEIIRRTAPDGTLYSKPDGETCQDNINDIRWPEFKTLIEDPNNTVEDYIDMDEIAVARREFLASQ